MFFGKHAHLAVVFGLVVMLVPQDGTRGDLFKRKPWSRYRRYVCRYVPLRIQEIDSTSTNKYNKWFHSSWTHPFSMTTGANMRSFNHMSYHSHLTDWKSTRLVAKPHMHLISMQSLPLNFYNTIIDCRLGTAPYISKTNRKHGAAPLPKPPTTSPPQSTKCILDTELYMKVVQKEVANVSNPIARIVPSTVAVTTGTAMRFWYSWFFRGVEHENIKPGNLDFPLCAKNYPWKAGLFRSLGGLLPVSYKVVVVKNKGNKSLKSPKNRHQRIYHKTIRIFFTTNHYFRNITAILHPKNKHAFQNDGLEKMPSALNLAIFDIYVG